MPDDRAPLDEHVDALRTALLCACATVLAIAFFALLVADQATATTFF